MIFLPQVIAAQIVDSTAFRRVDEAQRNPPNAEDITRGPGAWWNPGPKAPAFVMRIAGIASFALALTFATVFSMTSALAANIVLVTKEDIRAEAQAGIREPPRTRASPAPGAPKINVLQPVISGASLQNPIRIELQFASAPDADIDPGSFRAYYGFLRIDLTERIVKSVRVAKSGLKVENAEIPPGSHRLFLRIADSKERATETELRFVVE